MTHTTALLLWAALVTLYLLYCVIDVILEPPAEEGT